MTQFFVPAADTAAHAEEIYAAVARFNGLEPTSRRLQSLQFQHAGQPVRAEVGQPLPAGFGTAHQPVMAILETPEAYRVCLPARGGLWGAAILVPRAQAGEVRCFD